MTLNRRQFAGRSINSREFPKGSGWRRNYESPSQMYVSGTKDEHAVAKMGSKWQFGALSAHSTSESDDLIGKYDWVSRHKTMREARMAGLK